MFQRIAHRAVALHRASPVTIPVANYRYNLNDKYRVDFIHRGNGNKPRKGDSCTIHYTGRLNHDGTIFDTTYTRGQPFTFRVGFDQIIKGIDEGVSQMDLGSKAMITCPPDWAYGMAGMPGFIPGDVTLIYEVELVQVNGAAM